MQPNIYYEETQGDEIVIQDAHYKYYKYFTYYNYTNTLQCEIEESIKWCEQYNRTQLQKTITHVLLAVTLVLLFIIVQLNIN